MIVDYDCHSKEIIDFEKSREDFEQEKEVLSYMRCLRHLNIVELLGSFTFKDKHYLLFPPAEQDLEQLMSFSRAPARFDSDEAYLLALQGLGSAVNHMHTYTSNVLDIAMIGCHYDLKPKNILVLEDGFILADFGISRLKNMSEDSQTEFNVGIGYYLAPECPNPTDGFEFHEVGRASDIWSFGCVLAELLVNMASGAQGVEAFRVARGTIDLVYGFVLRRFYEGISIHPVVDAWLSKPDLRATQSRLDLVGLVRDSLAMDPQSRPKSSEVASRLRLLGL